MNKTQKILDMLSATESSHISVQSSVSEVKEVLDNTTDIMKQIEAKLLTADASMTTAERDIWRMDFEKDNLKAKFKENIDNLNKADEQYKEAKKKVSDVENTSAVLNIKYNNTKDKLNEKKAMLDSVLKRVLALDKKAGNAVNNIQNKLTILSELTKKYQSNEKRAEDLTEQLKKLTIKAKFTRNRLKELSACHSECNPALTERLICQSELQEIDRLENLEVAALKT